MRTRTTASSPFAERAARALAYAALPVAVLAACSSANHAERTEVAGSESTVGSTWKGWVSLSGGLVSDPVIVTDGDLNNLRRDVFATGPDGAVYTRTYDRTQWLPGGGSWTRLGNAGHPVGPPAALAWSGRIELFVRDETTHHLLFQELLGGAWNAGGWKDLGGDLAPGKPSVTRTNSKIEIFARASDGTVAMTSTYGYALGSGGWTSLAGAVLYEPTAVTWGGTRLDAFVAGTDHKLYHRYSIDEGVTWYPGGGAWESMGGSIAATPAVTTWGPNDLDIFVSATDTSVNHLAFNGSWGPWQALGGSAYRDAAHGVSAPVAYTSAPNRVDVFVQGDSRALWHTSTVSALGNGNFTYAAWDQVASCFRTGGAPSVASRDNVNLDVVVTGFDATNNGSVWFQSTEPYFSGQGQASPPSCACGDPGQTCCKDDSCPSGGVCGGSPRVCGPVGKLGTPCSKTGTPCEDWSTCNAASQCVSCGLEGEPACPGAHKCKDAAYAISNVNGVPYCWGCGFAPFLCCQAGAPACQTGFTCGADSHCAKSGSGSGSSGGGSGSGSGGPPPPPPSPCPGGGKLQDFSVCMACGGAPFTTHGPYFVCSQEDANKLALSTYCPGDPSECTGCVWGAGVCSN